MPDLTLGSLCTGYGGLDLATKDVLGARTIWTAENDPHAAIVTRARFRAPNLGDIKLIDWDTIPRPDIIAAVTGPFVELARPRPYQFQQSTEQTADVAPDAWDTYDPTDDEFPIRDPGDFTPPAAFGGLPGL